MNDLELMLGGWAAKWWQWIAPAFWQSALIAMIAIVLVWVFRRQWSSQARYALLLVALMKFVVPPVWWSPTSAFTQALPLSTSELPSPNPFSDRSEPSLESQHIPIFTSSNGETGPNSRAQALLESYEAAKELESNLEGSEAIPVRQWRLWLLIIYIGGVLIGSIRLFKDQRLIRRLCANAQPCQREPLTSSFETLRAKWNTSPLSQLFESESIDAPVAVGLFRPKILIPANLDKNLSLDQIEIILTHELIHIKRRDLWVASLQSLILIIWWFHPMIRSLNRILRSCQEDCCDDLIVVHRSASPERYCETMIQAAKQNISPLSDSLALGFASQAHPIARRMTRLMDPHSFKSPKIGFVALAFVALVALMTLPGAARPGGTSPVIKVDLQGMFGWKNLPFKLSAEMEENVKTCVELAKGRFRSTNGVAEFEREETKKELESILKDNPNMFYAQQLLASWHRIHSNTVLANRLRAQAFSNAPVVLVQRFLTPDGRPAQGIKIDSISIEHNRVQNRYLDPSLILRFLDLTTDGNGEIRLPVFDTVFRISSHSNPNGYSLEYESLGWFKSNGKYGLLPEVLIWKTHSQPKSLSRNTQDSPLLKKAQGTDKKSLRIDGSVISVTSVSRMMRDGSTITEDGDSHQVRSKFETSLTELRNQLYMDHAVIRLETAPSQSVDIEKIHFLESRSKLPLNEFQEGPIWKKSTPNRIHLSSLKTVLPKQVDLVITARFPGAGAKRANLSPEQGARTEIDGAIFTLEEIHAGQYSSWNSKTGFQGEPRNLNSHSELVLTGNGSKQVNVSIYVALKNGKMWNLKDGGWFSNTKSLSPISVPANLADISHFEFRPYSDKKTIYFENIRLPDIDRKLVQQIPSITLPRESIKNTTNISYLCEPFEFEITSYTGKPIRGTSQNSRNFSFLFWDTQRTTAEEEATVAFRLERPIPFKISSKLKGPNISLDSPIKASGSTGGQNSPYGSYQIIQGDLKQADAIVINFE
ncbi:MAG: hypothetical protein HOI66_22905 [Verrucomicrobia bacterium]|nr:hypothetical protein [Verrucomicrobiota bacterium]